MKMVLIIVVAATLAASAATAEPTGLSGLGLGMGGQFTGGVSQGRLGGQFDFELSPYVSLGPEIMFSYGDGFPSMTVGAETRIYFIPKYDLNIQPHALAGGGYGGLFANGGHISFGYIHAGGGMDFDVPETPMAPYFDAGGLFWIGAGAAAWFSVEGGIRLDVW